MATHDFFASITQIFDFFCVSKFWKVDKFAASIERLKTKSASASRGASPPGPRWGLGPQTPVIDSRYRARHGTVPPPDVAG